MILRLCRTILVATLILALWGSTVLADRAHGASDKRISVLSNAELLSRAKKGITDRPGPRLKFEDVPGMKVVDSGSTTQRLGKAIDKDGLSREHYLTFAFADLDFADNSLSRTATDGGIVVRVTYTMYWSDTLINGNIHGMIDQVSSTWTKLDSQWSWRNASIIALHQSMMYTDTQTFSIGVPTSGTEYSRVTSTWPHGWLNLENDYNWLKCYTRIELYRGTPEQSYWFQPPTIQYNEMP